MPTATRKMPNSGPYLILLCFFIVACDAKLWDETSTPDQHEIRQGLDMASTVTEQDKIDVLTESNEIPNLARNDELIGVDHDNNGIRDDIDEYIELHFEEENQQKAVKQFASAMQKMLVSDTSDIIAVKEINRGSSRAVKCIYSQFSEETGAKYPAAVTLQIEAITNNTKARLKAYACFAKALDGTSWSLPQGDTCEYR